MTDGSSTRRSLAAQLIRVVPRDVDRDPKSPSTLFTMLHQMPGKELQLLDEIRARPGLGNGEQLDLIDEFWTQTLPAALELPFRGVQAPFANIRGMMEFFDHENPAADR